MQLMNSSIPNTLGVPSVAEKLYEVDSLSSLQVVLSQNESIIVLGEASNVVLPPQLTQTVCLMKLRGISFEKVEGKIRVTSGAGESWHGLVRRCLANEAFGLENLALIPGSVGAAPIQNIGAYGVQLSDHFVSLRAIKISTGEIIKFSREDACFGYRESYFKSPSFSDYVIFEVTLELNQKPDIKADYYDIQEQLKDSGITKPRPIDIASAVIRVRRRKLPNPQVLGNTGSFFKNPIITRAMSKKLLGKNFEFSMQEQEDGEHFKVSAAQLIDAAGLKGLSIGRAAVWKRQPLVLVNEGGATAQEFLLLAETIRQEVKKAYGIALELEPIIL
ncbi:MAG: UDP-N-acetylenolpyruvoylglucosamine reductase [Gammaproteobacteria bacterium]|nr:UDP-N-acetylenolpyruvoylglucosamine reductase [Gammaproteobacteria bacterium]